MLHEETKLTTNKSFIKQTLFFSKNTLNTLTKSQIICGMVILNKNYFGLMMLHTITKIPTAFTSMHKAAPKGLIAVTPTIHLSLAKTANFSSLDNIMIE